MGKLLALAAACLLLAGAVNAEEIVCRGNIISQQGEGLITRQHRFEVAGVSGGDQMAVLDKCKEIARKLQNKAARSNPASHFRKFSDVDLECTKGTEMFKLRRTLQTEP